MKGGAQRNRREKGRPLPRHTLYTESERNDRQRRGSTIEGVGDGRAKTKCSNKCCVCEIAGTRALSGASRGSAARALIDRGTDTFVREVRGGM